MTAGAPDRLLGVEAERAIDRRGLLGLVAGGVLGTLAARRGTPEARGPVALWLADRGTELVHGLDRRGLHRVAVAVRDPAVLGPGRDGGVWALSGRDAGSSAVGHDWVRLGSGGERLGEGSVPGPCRAIAAARDGLWCVARGGRELVRLRGSGAASWPLAELDGAGVVAGGGEDALVLGSRGEAVWFEGGAPRAAGCLPEPALDGCSSRDGWWLRSRSGVIELDRDLELRALHEAGEAPGGLFPTESRDGAWVLDRRGRCARRLGASGRVRREWSLAGVGTGAELEGGRLLLVAPGALVVLDGRGEPLPGQGGFRELVDLSRAGPFASVGARAGPRPGGSWRRGESVAGPPPEASARS